MPFDLRRVRRAARPAMLSICVLAIATAPAVQAATFWDFRSGGSPETVTGGSFSVHRTFTEDGMTVDVSAWANTGQTPLGSFAGGYLGRYRTGLGVCNAGEVLGTGGLANCIHGGGVRAQVDNVGQHDLVLFVFSGPVALESITIDPLGLRDRDMSFWVGNVTAPLSLTGLTFASLPGIGFGQKTDSLNGIGVGPLTVSLGGALGNALLVGARYPSDLLADKFKIQSLRTTAAPVVPLPASLWLLASAVGVLSSLARRSR